MKTGEIILATLATAVVAAALAYLAVFGRALNQDEDHLSIAMSLPKVILRGGVAEVGERKLLTANRDDFHGVHAGFRFNLLRTARSRIPVRKGRRQIPIGCQKILLPLHPVQRTDTLLSQADEFDF